ncbi:MAG: Uma2 family endonuclease, partial [Balneolaceae bacterium]|nr:Uma2 family endonuclease [Balneolaceae bacterium]
ENEPQPDALLRISSESAGRSKISEDDYLEGVPELIVEIAASTASYDMHQKKHVYARNGVPEYLVYLGYTATSSLNLGEAEGEFSVQWYNPREGGALQEGTVTSVTGGSRVGLGYPPEDRREDWLVIVRKEG